MSFSADNDMKARLSIFSEDKTLFFNTLCELSLDKNKAQMEFPLRSEDKEARIILGINRKKITVLRIVENTDRDEDDIDEGPQEDIFVLSSEKNEPSKAVISLDGIDLYFSTDYFFVRIGKNYVEAMVGCAFRTADSKTDLRKIFLKCVAEKPKTKII
jgi:hypothetical protein